jgi:hypothetical protein
LFIHVFLNLGLYDVSGSIQLTKLNDSNDIICSDEEEDEEPEGPPDEASQNIVGADINEEDFLSEYESLEKTLSDIIYSSA